MGATLAACIVLFRLAGAPATMPPMAAIDLLEVRTFRPMTPTTTQLVYTNGQTDTVTASLGEIMNRMRGTAACSRA